MSWKTDYRSIYYDGAPEPEDPDLAKGSTALLIIDVQNTYLARLDRASLSAEEQRRYDAWSPFHARMRDIVIPQQLQDAMSREAQASREKQARIILGEAEMAIAQSFDTASRVYHNNPTALHLRAMNMLYEGLKEKGALMLIPSSAVESMGMGGLLGAAALRQQKLAAGGDDGQTPPE